MIDIPEMRRLYRVTRFDFWIAVAAIVGVLSFGVLAGVLIGVVLSLGWLIYVATQPRNAAPRSPARDARYSENSTSRRTMRHSPASRWSAWTLDCSSRRQRHSRTACANLMDTATPPLRALVLDLEGVNFIDSQGAAKLIEILELTETQGVVLRLARVKPICARRASRRRIYRAARCGTYPR